MGGIGITDRQGYRKGKDEDASGQKCWACAIKANQVPTVSISAKDNAVSPCSRSVIIPCLILRTMRKRLNFALPTLSLAGLLSVKFFMTSRKKNAQVI